VEDTDDAKTRARFTLFVASPSDLAEQCTRLEKIVRDLNSGWNRRLGRRLELVVQKDCEVRVVEQRDLP
jgi:hypothetical protein